MLLGFESLSGYYVMGSLCYEVIVLCQEYLNLKKTKLLFKQVGTYLPM